MVFFFFFQAEDGIRYRTVTGVQTCALPIFALYDTREGSPTRGQLMELLMGDGHPTCVKIPPGVAHGCRALDLSHLLYVTSHVYSPEDEGRIPHDDPTIGYDW